MLFENLGCKRCKVYSKQTECKKESHQDFPVVWESLFQYFAVTGNCRIHEYYINSGMQRGRLSYLEIYFQVVSILSESISPLRHSYLTIIYEKILIAENTTIFLVSSIENIVPPEYFVFFLVSMFKFAENGCITIFWFYAQFVLYWWELDKSKITPITNSMNFSSPQFHECRLKLVSNSFWLISFFAYI